jgi:N-acetyl-anhydromuramyl-L-alanine amidase AmpD
MGVMWRLDGPGISGRYIGLMNPSPAARRFVVPVAVLLVLAAVATQAVARSRRNGPPATPRGWAPPVKSDRWECIVIHHSATDFGGARRFDAGHKDKGWDGLGYHFVIGNGSDTRDGLVEVGPRWREQRTGAHCRSPEDYYNEHGIGICLVGNFDEEKPTAAQMKSLTKLVRFLCRRHDIPASKVHTHGGVTHQTRCPGKHFDLRALRKAAR